MKEFETRILHTSCIAQLENELEILINIYESNFSTHKIRMEMVDKMNIIYGRLRVLREL